MHRIAIWVVCAAALAACGSKSSPSQATTTVAAPAVTTTTTPGAGIEARPASGPIGTSFELIATRFLGGETVTFEITYPDGKTFKGRPHQAAVDGTVTASFRVTTGNPLGTYKVTATGDKSSHAVGHFEVTSAASTSTAVNGHSSTTGAGRTTTTKKP